MSEEFIISRVFAAPRDLVFKAHTDCEHLRHWWGPKGFTMHTCKLDLRPGGVFHYGMRSPGGDDMWGRFVFREIVPPERLVWVNSFSDAQGGLTRHPFAPDWPAKMLSTITFEPKGRGTLLTIQWEPSEASEAELRTFDAGRSSMTQGWTGTCEHLTDYLKKG